MLKRFPRNLTFILAGILAVAGLSGILLLYGRLTRTGEEEVLRSMSKAAAQAAINLNTRMRSVNDAMQTLVADPRFSESVQRAPGEETLENQLDEIRPLREAVASAAENRFVSQIRVYLNGQKLITHEGVNFLNLTEAVRTREYLEMEQLRTHQHWMGLHTVETRYLYGEYLTLGRIYRFSFLSDTPNWALLLFDVSPETFADVLDGLEMPGEDTAIAIADSSGRLILGSPAEIGFPEILESASGETWSFVRGEDGEFACIVQPLETEDWSLILCTRRDSLLSGQHNLRMLLMLSIFGLTLLLIALIVITAMTIYTRRVNAYVRGLNRDLASGGSPGPRTPTHGALFRLGRNIGDLLETNKHLTEEKLDAELRERELTLQALQAQINPHFLYNTLDSINWLAIREHAPSVSSAVTMLADYFRLSLSRGRSIVTLDEEAEIVRLYLKLYEDRYDVRYRVEWDLAPETLPCTLPKLTLQPLVENALQHGIFERRDRTGGLVRIASVLTGGQLILTVADNGPGISGDADLNKGYGLGNIRKRLDLYFNGRYELLFENAPEGGAVITLKISPEEASPDAADTKNAGSPDGTGGKGDDPP